MAGVTMGLQAFGHMVLAWMWLDVLLVSGGHTQLMRVQAVGDYELLGETIDDAAGEAFDKIAKSLGLPYPGGPHVEKEAERGDPERFALPRPMLGRPAPDFSLSIVESVVRDSGVPNAVSGIIFRKY